MSVSNIESTAARLNALETSTNRNSTAVVNPDNASGNTAVRANLRIETGPAVPTYNKQALISSYLGRGKETTAARQSGPLEGPNKQGDNSKQA
ncbi:hypothetical protein DFH28DRAFT_878375 [Melampsora americana]|nr:hypothetical protein DFH28DRAFT_878375 [Melampsora americana]